MKQTDIVDKRKRIPMGQSNKWIPNVDLKSSMDVNARYNAS